MIKAVIFDCFGVLTADLWREFCDSLPPGPQVQAAKELNRQFDAKKITQEEFVQGVHTVTGRIPKQVEQLLGSESPKNTALLHYIAELKSKNYKIGILSNVGTNWIRASFLTPEEQSLFDDMLFSFEVGLIKPDPQFYILAAQRLGVQMDECVFTDDVKGFCIVAQDQGMQAVWYQNFEQMKHELDVILYQK